MKRNNKHRSIDKTDKSGYNIIKGVDIMSTREIAYNIIDCMSEEQLSAFVALFGNAADVPDVPNEETLEAMREVEDMKLHPENYKSYDDVDVMFKELLA